MNYKPNNFTNPTKKYFPISSEFGERYIFGKWQFHNGVDIACPEGTEIICPADGVVIETNYNTIAGNYIRIQHHCGLITGYAHLKEILISQGQEVTQGQVIAKSGNTGLSTGAHLHFTCYENGQFQNPRLYFDL